MQDRTAGFRRFSNVTEKYLDGMETHAARFCCQMNLANPADLREQSGVASLDTTLGDIYTLEWAISKTVVPGVDVGLTGYYQQQVTATEGPTPNGPTWQNERIHVAGIGPEVGVTLPKWGLSASLRYAYEFSAMDHPQGHLINLTVTKSF